MAIPSPSNQQMQLRAYQFWKERGSPWGTPDVDWFKAEGELMSSDTASPLSKVARELGTAIGTVVAFLGEIDPPSPEPS
jgi:hypothetical protein